jgi:hypothetical protein
MSLARAHVASRAHSAQRLGINTKSATPYVDNPGKNAKKLVNRAAFVERYALQNAARSLLPGHRVAHCLRWRIAKSDAVDVLHAPAVGAAHYGNLITCGSVWHCPVCTAKIATRRVEELEWAIVAWQGERFGGSNLMMTFTIQHSQNENCAYVLDGLLKAHRKFWSGEPARRFKERYGIGGQIRALETTHGENGWHAHLHVLLFLRNQEAIFLDGMRQYGAERWQSVLARHERYASLAHGVDIRSANDFIAEYVLKFGKLPESRWTEAHELSHAHRKRAATGGQTPMGLLQDHAYGDPDAGALWVEYAKAFKGKRQLYWSPGLRNLLGLAAEKSDEELAAEQREVAVIMARLDQHQWRQVVSNDIRAEVLQTAASGDQVALKQYLEDFGIDGVEYPGLNNGCCDSPVIDLVVYTGPDTGPP